MRSAAKAISFHPTLQPHAIIRRALIGGDCVLYLDLTYEEGMLGFSKNSRSEPTINGGRNWTNLRGICMAWV